MTIFRFSNLTVKAGQRMRRTGSHIRYCYQGRFQHPSSLPMYLVILSNEFASAQFRIILNIFLILIRPCATQSKSARFRCFFFLLYFTTCFDLTGHHQVCLRSLLRFPSDVWAEQIHNTRENELNIFNKHKTNTWLDTKIWHNITWMKHLEASNTSTGKHSRLL
jgi:hypothetical protein